MADLRDRDEAVDRLLDGWGGPPPRAGFADRVLDRVEAQAPVRDGPSRRSWARAFALGGVVGGLVVGSAATLGSRAREAAPARLEQPTHLQAPGVAEVVGESGSEVRWRRRAGGGFVVEVVEGVAWVRSAAVDQEFSVVAGDEEVRLEGSCARIAVRRRFLGVDVTADVVDCARVDAAIAQARAELPDRRAR